VSVTVSRVRGATVVVAAGEIDIAAREEFQQALDGSSPVGGLLIVDLSRCSYIDSSGLSVLIRAHKQGATIAVVLAASDAVNRVFRISGLDRLFRFVDSVEEALGGHAA